jgi:hypothetical protein
VDIYPSPEKFLKNLKLLGVLKKTICSIIITMVTTICSGKCLIGEIQIKTQKSLKPKNTQNKGFYIIFKHILALQGLLKLRQVSIKSSNFQF